MKGPTADALAITGSLLAAGLAAASLFEPGFYAGHDNLLNAHRLFELERCFDEGTWLCLWAPDMGAGLGVPLFQYYAPLPTYIAAGLRGFGLSLTSAVQASAGLALFVLAIGSFVLGRSLWGRIGGLWTATLMVLAPYVAVDVYVRGASNELWALALLPWLWWTLRGTLASARNDARRRFATGLALVGAAIVLAHPLVCIAAAPLTAAWLIGHGASSRARAQAFGSVGAALALALLLSAFYWVPALAERDEIHREVLISRYSWSRFENNFLAAAELFRGTGPWSYGPFRRDGGMSLFLGAPAVLAALSGVALLFRARASERAVCVALAVGTAATLFLVLEPSAPLWRALPPLAYLQFPWRLLGPAALGLALLGGGAGSAIERLIPRGRRRPTWRGATLGLLLVCAGWNAGYFRAEAQRPIADDVLVNPLQVARSRHGLFDYLPRSVDLERLPASPPGALPAAVVALPPSAARVSVIERGSHRLRFRVESEEGALLRIQRHRFPEWYARVDGQPIVFEERGDARGRLFLRVPAGAHEVAITLRATPVRRLARAASALGLLLLGAAGLASLRMQRSSPGASE